MKIIRIAFILMGLVWNYSVQAEDIRNIKAVNGNVIVDTPEFLITHDKPFFGLAFIYNNVQPIFIVENEVVFVNPEVTSTVPRHASYFGWKSRYQLALFESTENVTAKFENNKLQLKTGQLVGLNSYMGYIDNYAQFSELKYAHLWGWLRQISLGIEWMLATLNQWVGHWGWSIVLLSIVMKLLLLPVGLMTLRFQRMVSKNQTLLAPKLAEIKQKYKGEQAHNEMMAAHKALGITPFYTLKPMMSNLVQIPILVAIFNVLGEMSQLEGQPFLWVKDLSLPDTLYDFGLSVPLFGSGLNLLPIVMTIITLLSTIYYKNELAPAAETRKQKINLYFMAFGFFVLFYPFPASMVLYWAMANILQFIQQKYLGN